MGTYQACHKRQRKKILTAPLTCGCKIYLGASSYRPYKESQNDTKHNENSETIAERTI